LEIYDGKLLSKSR
jgi:hypothetical protein